jgi:hypothetical protein
METESNKLSGCCAGNATLASVTASIGVKINAALKLRMDYAGQGYRDESGGHIRIAARHKPNRSCVIA